MTEDRNHETTTQGDDSELTELDAPPAAPLSVTPAGEGDGEEEESTPASSPSIRERMAQLKDRETSPGFGVAGKFSEARADYTDQGSE